MLSGRTPCTSTLKFSTRDSKELESDRHGVSKEADSEDDSRRMEYVNRQLVAVRDRVETAKKSWGGRGFARRESLGVVLAELYF
jgi:hypothetical protein